MSQFRLHWSLLEVAFFLTNALASSPVSKLPRFHGSDIVQLIFLRKKSCSKKFPVIFLKQNNKSHVWIHKTSGFLLCEFHQRSCASRHKPKSRRANSPGSTPFGRWSIFPWLLEKEKTQQHYIIYITLLQHYNTPISYFINGDLKSLKWHTRTCELKLMQRHLSLARLPLWRLWRNFGWSLPKGRAFKNFYKDSCYQLLLLQVLSLVSKPLNGFNRRNRCTIPVNSNSKTFNPKPLEPSNPGTFKVSNPETHGAFPLQNYLYNPQRKIKTQEKFKDWSTRTLMPWKFGFRDFGM